MVLLHDLWLLLLLLWLLLVVCLLWVIMFDSLMFPCLIWLCLVFALKFDLVCLVSLSNVITSLRQEVLYQFWNWLAVESYDFHTMSKPEFCYISLQQYPLNFLNIFFFLISFSISYNGLGEDDCIKLLQCDMCMPQQSACLTVTNTETFVIIDNILKNASSKCNVHIIPPHTIIA